MSTSCAAGHNCSNCFRKSSASSVDKNVAISKGHLRVRCVTMWGMSKCICLQKNHPLIVATDFGRPPFCCDIQHVPFDDHMAEILPSSLFIEWPWFPRWCRSSAPSRAEGPNRGGCSVIFGVVKTEGQDASYALGPAKGIDHWSISSSWSRPTPSSCALKKPG